MTNAGQFRGEHHGSPRCELTQGTALRLEYGWATPLISSNKLAHVGETRREEHHTLAGALQRFVYCMFRKNNA